MEVKEKTLQLLEELQEDEIKIVYQFLEQLKKENQFSKSRPKNYLHSQKITDKFSGNFSDIIFKERQENL